MSRISRILLVLMVVAFVGVWLLSGMARRYSRMLDTSDAPGEVRLTSDPTIEEAQAQVDAFIRVRAALHAAERSPQGAPTRQELSDVREQALSRTGLSPATYERIRLLYRSWSDGTGPAGVFAPVFERRRERLARVGAAP